MLGKWTSIDIRLRLALVALIVAFAPIAWYLGSPLFINRTVNESFPISAPAAESMPAATAMAAMPAVTAETGLAMADAPATAMAAMPAATTETGLAMADAPATAM